MNFVFVSPHFPENFRFYCQALKRNGVTVLGIADTPYENLHPELQAALSDYYRVDALEDGEQLLKALGWFTWRHGKIDWLESNNEYWLEQDAWLREAFHITTGPLPDKMDDFKRKSRMKAVYAKAGVKTAPWQLLEGLEQAAAFGKSVGYPLIIKPDTGVGASDTHLVESEEELRLLYARLPIKPYIMEKRVTGEVCSYDALIGAMGQPLYETGNITRGNIMDMVNKGDDCTFYIIPQLPQDLLDLGRACVAAYGVRQRLIHFEFFRLTQDQKGLGNKGDLLGLEVNMRPSGGYSSDMINFAGSVDIYQMWADMVCHDRIHIDPARQTYYCLFLGRRDFKHYAHPHGALLEDWGHRVMMQGRMPEALSGTMGNQMYLLQCKNQDEVDAFLEYSGKVR